MTTVAQPGLAEMKQRTRVAWAAGDYAEIARTQLWEVGPRLVRRVGIGAGEDVLDVACGTGNAAIRAAEAGGRVVGVDLTPELFDAGRRQAAEAGVEIEWVEGDAEELPFEDGSFDVVLSTFGCMFAPRHEVAAAELARVLRPGGRLGVCAWTPEGLQGEFFRTLGSCMPPPPDFAQPPLLWGNEQHVREIFAGTGVRLEFDRDSLAMPFSSGAEAVDFGVRNFGPLIVMRDKLESEGSWSGLLDSMAAIYDRDQPAEYLIALGRKS